VRDWRAYNIEVEHDWTTNVPCVSYGVKLVQQLGFRGNETWRNLK